MERLNEMVTFATVVEAQGFARAADLLGTSRSQVSKQVRQLELALGTRLLNRTTRSLGLTEVGAAYYQHCARIMQEIEAASHTVAQMQDEPRGLLRLTAPTAFATLHLAPILQSFQAAHPGIGIELDVSDRSVDMVGENVDLAIRLTGRPLASMVARELAPVRLLACAAPGYLQQRGTPSGFDQLEHHRCLEYAAAAATSSLSWRFQLERAACSVRPETNCRINNAVMLLQMAVAGGGIALLPSYITGPQLRSGELVEVFPGMLEGPMSALVAMYTPNRFMQVKVRAFIDHLLETMGHPHYWQRH
jgi:DNA-binding transcriptional LysR family regulator